MDGIARRSDPELLRQTTGPSAAPHAREEQRRSTHRNSVCRITEQLVLVGNCIADIRLAAGVAFHVTLLCRRRNPDGRLPVCVREKDLPTGTRRFVHRCSFNVPMTVPAQLLQANDMVVNVRVTTPTIPRRRQF